MPIGKMAAKAVKAMLRRAKKGSMTTPKVARKSRTAVAAKARARARKIIK